MSRNMKNLKEANALHVFWENSPIEQVAFTVGIAQGDWLGNIISLASWSNAINRIHKLYPILCHIPSSGPNILILRLA